MKFIERMECKKVVALEASGGFKVADIFSPQAWRMVPEDPHHMSGPALPTLLF